MIITLPLTNRELVLHRFDLEEALNKLGVDYLFVASQPVVEASVGKPYQYQLSVKSKRGGVTYRLESGPEGMKLDAKGKLTWAVPADFEAADAPVVVEVISDVDAMSKRAWRPTA